MKIYRLTQTMSISLLLTPLFSAANERTYIYDQIPEGNALLSAIIENDIPSILQIKNNNDIDLVYTKSDSNNIEISLPTKKTKVVKIISTEFIAKMEVLNERNKKLRRHEKRENEMEFESLLRMNTWFFQSSPIYGRAEIEWKQKTKRKSSSSTERKTQLELNQAYIGLNKNIIPYTHLRLGRWLYRDEREWLFDENLDGISVQSQLGNWQLEVIGGKVNYWRKDLLDRSPRNITPTNIGSFILRRKIKDKWHIGAYTIAQRDTDDRSQQFNIGLRSHNPAKNGMGHWLELGLSEQQGSSTKQRGYAIDLGGTYLFNHDRLKPRMTLGYAFGGRHYRQTGLNGNEATFGGDSKFKIYGETLNPSLTNIHILTAGLGINITQHSTLDVVYHTYNQAQLTHIENNELALKSRYDSRNTHHLGSAVDLVLGWEPTNNIKLEAIAGMFSPSKRFTNSDKSDSPRSDRAYSIGMEVEIKF